jgi:hypothetical protein
MPHFLRTVGFLSAEKQRGINIRTGCGSHTQVFKHVWKWKRFLKIFLLLLLLIWAVSSKLEFTDDKSRGSRSGNFPGYFKAEDLEPGLLPSSTLFTVKIEKSWDFQIFVSVLAFCSNYFQCTSLNASHSRVKREADTVSEREKAISCLRVFCGRPVDMPRPIDQQGNVPPL